MALFIILVFLTANCLWPSPAPIKVWERPSLVLERCYHKKVLKNGPWPYELDGLAPHGKIAELYTQCRKYHLIGLWNIPLIIPIYNQPRYFKKMPLGDKESADKNFKKACH